VVKDSCSAVSRDDIAAILGVTSGDLKVVPEVNGTCSFGAGTASNGAKYHYYTVVELRAGARGQQQCDAARSLPGAVQVPGQPVVVQDGTNFFMPTKSGGCLSDMQGMDLSGQGLRFIGGSGPAIQALRNAYNDN
jgi:hypothetical protein